MLKKLHARALRIIRERVRCDVHYVGSSVATNMACPTLHTTNGMPIVETSTFQALGSVPLQITLATSNTTPTARGPSAQPSHDDEPDQDGNPDAPSASQGSRGRGNTPHRSAPPSRRPSETAKRSRAAPPLS
ncbi:Type 1 glutamine amidotransferase-like domain-containing protein [Streptomyces sp. WAC07094]|uniref:Type 1 glutamine amidotransferase-like domain-containing protein n=1 Tax=Streptomyces sp. WAC07094 TaxID=3072183 RepID=UPI002ECE2C06|nr:Type 1 glutamine amidotransferase-like domain-containing protein [Streptomyces sp. WAC07094]